MCYLFRRQAHIYLRPLERRCVLRSFRLRRPPVKLVFNFTSLTSTADTLLGDTFMRELLDTGATVAVLFFLGTLLQDGEDSIDPMFLTSVYKAFFTPIVAIEVRDQRFCQGMLTFLPLIRQSLLDSFPFC